MRSDEVKKGYSRAPHRSLLRATGLKDEDFNGNLFKVNLVKITYFRAFEPYRTMMNYTELKKKFEICKIKK